MRNGRGRETRGRKTRHRIASATQRDSIGKKKTISQTTCQLAISAFRKHNIFVSARVRNEKRITEYRVKNLLTTRAAHRVGRG